MDILYTHCAGLDVHKRTIVACLLTPGSRGRSTRTVRTFGTMTADLMAEARVARRRQLHSCGDASRPACFGNLSIICWSTPSPSYWSMRSTSKR
jgi:hypothetical protein